MSTQTLPSPLAEPTFAELFTPKLVTVFREGYSFANFQADLMAGLTVAIVALPLSMAIAISALSGSRFQIGGPAGAFIVLVAATLQQHGMDGLILATILSGIILMGIGYLRLGTYIKFIPYPVTVGFTAGIAVTIFSSEIKPLLGLSFSGAEPGPLMEKIPFVVETAHPLARRARSFHREHRAAGGLAHLPAAMAGHADRCRVSCACDCRAQATGRYHRISVWRHSA
jgi:sulfate permease, SulP family